MDTLPIFLKLAGRRVILIGDGEAAEAKARLIRAAGGRIVAEAEDAALAFIALDDDAEATAHAARLRQRGLLVNVVDRPALSDFLMGAIIDRSPVVLAVSTGGASASLARALRTRLEALLPASLGPLARAILAARDAVSRHHPTPSDRRRLWERALAEGAPLDPFASLPDPAAAVSATITGTSTTTPQIVHIPITSPDPGDLTLNQLNLLARCDTLVMQGPIPTAVVDRARRDATRLDAVPTPLPAGVTVVLGWDGEG
ncbi:hypothetical protein CHU93_00880 [Sandarakinorhabdus cyanobacteriorum]|uniref:precorrin-2 dehydrogenase n=1 Tax=Sandarakinorhabdus cyanobacteriorum TaxID=1981098 RepID=A0A255Z6U2_9SPHN|nr:bifunctional precorrin-2 dehydrogenase/sirohydrochlorin ferrochelatase [Sandarakinorhabdus cyanobacteriorum]OYQ36615.1 hypothetical protein CHU93_00880 [Sandarakinorhabdus cyanobacteriorum]